MMISSRIVLCSLILSAVAACSDVPVSTSGEALPTLLQQVRSDAGVSGLTLRTALLNSELTVGEPIELLVLVVNGEHPRDFSNDPDLYRFDVVDQDGVSVPAHSIGSLTRALGTESDLRLAAHAVIGRVVNLDCITQPYYPLDQRPCEYGYTPQEPGTYRVITVYQHGDSVLHRPDFNPVFLVDTTSVIIR